jgi:hypothetical protein
MVALLAKRPLQPSHNIGHLKPTSFRRRSGHKSRKNLSAPRDLYLLAFFNPGRDARKVVPQVSNSRRFHRETSMSHKAHCVNKSNNFLLV